MPTADNSKEVDANQPDYKQLYETAIEENSSLLSKNEDLQARLPLIAPDLPISTDPNPYPSTWAPSSSNTDASTRKIEFIKLHKRYKALSENFKIARAALDRRRDERNYWMKYAGTLKDLIQSTEKDHNIEIFQLGSGSSDALQPSETFVQARSASDSFSADLEAAEQRRMEPPAIPRCDPAKEAQTGEQSTQGSSEETTKPSAESSVNQEELPALIPASSDDRVFVKDEPSSDQPFLVLERAVKRKRDAHESQVTPRVRIKDEPLSSSPTNTPIRPPPQSQESLDLDDVGQRTMTPRKRSDFDSPIAAALPHHVAASINTGLNASNSSQTVPQTLKVRHLVSAITPTSIKGRMVRSGRDRTGPEPQALRYQPGVGELADDGEDALHLQNTVTPVPNRTRLSALLNTPVHTEPETVLRRPQQRQALSNAAASDLNIPQRRELPFDKQGRPFSRPLATSPKKTSLCSPEKRPAVTKRNGVPSLRGRSISELKIEDFRINPAANDGYDFAYSEVVRDREERSCMTGCTDMHCCGKQFRALALSQRPNPPLTPAQQREEQKLLEDYLGDAAFRLGIMTPQERAETWVEAKTHELANKYGRHRHRYARQQSPPGFWDADFPNTQELASDRKEASKRERKAIADRYREAMRPGGRWIFRDE